MGRRRPRFPDCSNFAVFTMTTTFPPLPTNWAPTREALHACARLVRVLPAALAIPDPRFWHVGLRVGPGGLPTAAMPHPGGGTFHLRIDLEGHEVAIEVDGETLDAAPIESENTTAQLATRIAGRLQHFGVDAGSLLAGAATSRPLCYDRAAALTFWEILEMVVALFDLRRAEMGGDVGPVHVWPHGFDLAFEWYADHVIRYDEAGETKEGRPQLNVGFFPTAPAYFYSNPFPFDRAALLDTPLPHGAVWHVSGWEGSLLPYGRLVGDPDAATKLVDYLAAVAAVSVPTLVRT